MTQKRMERKGNSSTVRSHKAGPQVTGVDSNHTQPTTHTHTKPAHRPSNTKQWLPPINHIEVISPPILAFSQHMSKRERANNPNIATDE
mmetsp:Transcript_35376/g.59938  ORF Transcript_35376/g.59938 Transcript_35376/m.59938 type:complete len:89 (-) Transcript_35376:662-928(-)